MFKHEIFVQIDDARYFENHKRYFYDKNWEFQAFSYNMPIRNDCIKKPKNFAFMKKLAIALAFDFVRVDLYEANGKVFVGELTFTPCGGLAKWNPAEIDKVFGKLW